MQAIATLERTISILKKYHLSTDKDLGQNFIIDNQIIKQIIKIADLKNSDFILEIGSGIGALTWELASLKKPIISVEIDQKLIPPLENEVIKYFDNIKLINNDILKINLAQLFNDSYLDFNNQAITVVGNLPYYITTPIMIYLLKSTIKINKIVLLIQKEAAERLLSKPKNKKYNYLNVLLQIYYDVKIIDSISKNVFLPIPKVDSVVIELITHNKYPDINKNQIIDFLKLCFLQKRKTLINNLKHQYGVDKIRAILQNNNLSITARAEELSSDKLITLFKEVMTFDNV